jgi:hypothetical protein
MPGFESAGLFATTVTMIVFLVRKELGCSSCRFPPSSRPECQAKNFAATADKLAAVLDGLRFAMWKDVDNGARPQMGPLPDGMRRGKAMLILHKSNRKSIKSE